MSDLQKKGAKKMKVSILNEKRQNEVTVVSKAKPHTFYIIVVSYNYGENMSYNVGVTILSSNDWTNSIIVKSTKKSNWKHGMKFTNDLYKIREISPEEVFNKEVLDEKEFEPIELKITLENEQEFQSLFSYSNNPVKVPTDTLYCALESCQKASLS